MTTLGKYEIVQELGTGSMGVIYRARDVVLDREVALKTIARAGSLDAELKERFYREARSCARLQHPNIVTVYDLGEQDGAAYIAMELLIGADLRKFIAEKRTLPDETKLELLAGVCEGLHHAHSHGIIHRDIKPSNIFLHEDGRAKILDFGVARLPTSNLTMMGRVLGTPHYMAPEQILGKPCDARSDLFSLAIVAFEFLTYSHPFFGESIPKRILHDAPDRLLSRSPQLPAELEAVIVRALQKDPAERYPTALEFGSQLRKIAEQLRGEAKEIRERAAPAAAFPSAEPSPDEIRVPANANTEYKMSALLTALEEFDRAMERRDIASGRRTLEVIRKVAAVDDRFSTALVESTRRLQELEASAPALAAAEGAQPEGGIGAAPAVPMTGAGVRAAESGTFAALESAEERPAAAAAAEGPGAKGDVAAAAPPTVGATTAAPTAEAAARPVFSDDATSLFTAAPALGGAVREPLQAGPPTSEAPRASETAPASETARAAVPLSSAQPEVKPIPSSVAATAPEAATGRERAAAAAPATGRALSRNLILLMGAIAALVVIGAGVIFLLRARSAKPLPAVATAEAVYDAPIFAAPASSRVVATAPRGARVNLLAAPRSRAQEWVQVQYISGGTVYPPGAMKTVNLANWSSPKPDVQYALLQTFAPASGAGESELRQHLSRLNDFIARFPGSAQEAAARVDFARLSIALARMEAAAGAPDAAEIAGAAQNLEAVQNRADLAGTVEQLKQELQGLQSDSKPGATAAAPARRPVDVERAIKSAENFWENGDYDPAERLLKRVLTDQPDNQRARSLLERVQRAKRAEGLR